MERLTTNKEVTDMSMLELAHNCSYVDAERNTRYRDFEMEMDARDFARNLMVTLTKDELPLDKTEFDEEILDNLTIDPFSDVRGLIAVFYRNLWAMADLREKLKCYEDAEEQGLLLRLPCKVGDTVYVIYYIDRHYVIYSHIISKFVIMPYRFPRVQIYFEKENGFLTSDFEGQLNDNLFLTREEAEAKLAEMEEKDGE